MTEKVSSFALRKNAVNALKCNEIMHDEFLNWHCREYSKQEKAKKKKPQCC